MSLFKLSRAAFLGAVLMAGAAIAQEVTTKVAIINIQDAITRTQEGQAAARTLQEEFKPAQDALAAKRREVDTLKGQLQRGANTMSEEARRDLAVKIDRAERSAQRDAEDAQEQATQKQQELVNEIGTKLMTVIDAYAKERGFSIVLDISSPQSPVLYAVNEVNITNDVIQRYDTEHPPATASAAPAGDASAAAKPAP